jgi:hypothetical protein
MSEHKCDNNHFMETGIKVVYGPFVDESWQSWVLSVRRLATPKDVYDGEAEKVGEEMFLSEFSISYCPFCGANLADQR